MNAAVRIGALGCVLHVMVVACGPASVQRVSGPSGTVPRPNLILVYDFAVTPDEVRLDSGIGSQLGQFFGGQDPGTSRTAEEIKIGHAVANAVAAALVKGLNDYGLQAERSLSAPSPGGRVLMVKGQLVSIDEGNRSERVLIGLGAGRTSVQANVQVYEVTPEGMRNVESLQADAKSGYKPGMALMMGAGGLAGSLLTSAVVSGITSAASEANWATVNSDGNRLGKNVAKSLGQFFVIQGWISPDALQ